MLAGPRVKQKFSINPRGASWSNDDSKFGQKIMEKFGWAKGKGLGAKEDGKTEHVKVSVKGDNRGVGCSKSYADNWIAHQDDFNQLLSNLNQNSESNDEDKSVEEKNKVQSLEVKSKTSRSRVHYMKFTKGKDLSSRSEQDLDCIFGKRKSKSESNTPLNQSAENSEDEETEEKSHGINIVKSTDSVQEYFARKMAELKRKRGVQADNSITAGENFESDNKFQKEEESDSDNKNEKTVSFTLGDDSSSENEGNTKSKKSKKKKKKEKKDLNENEKISIEEDEQAKTKKNKKKRKMLNEDEKDCSSPKMSKTTTLEEEQMEEMTKSKTKKKKSKKSKKEDISDESDGVQNLQLEQKTQIYETEKLKKKSKKSKKGKKDRN